MGDAGTRRQQGDALLPKQMLSVSFFQPRKQVRQAARLAAGLGLVLLVASTLSCAGRADLLPVTGVPPQDCPTSGERRLLITVSNQGQRPARATTTVVHYEGRSPVRLPTRPIAPAQSETLTAELPDDCLWSKCSFEIRVDDKEEVAERDESNNQIRGQCVSVGRRQPDRP